MRSSSKPIEIAVHKGRSRDAEETRLKEGEGGHNIDQQKQTMDLMIGLAEREKER